MSRQFCKVRATESRRGRQAGCPEMTQGQAITQRNDFVSGVRFRRDRSASLSRGRGTAPLQPGAHLLASGFQLLAAPLRRQLQLHLIFGKDDLRFRQGRSRLG